MLRRARRLRVFDSLGRVYDELPETKCENCARCCFESPGIFYIEYLHLLDLLARVSVQRREQLLRNALRELFFSWIEPGRACIFLESSRCTIYERRPLACRLFGLVPSRERDRAEGQARMAARQEARRLRLFGVEVPDAVVQRSLVSCDRVRDRRGRQVVVDGDAIAARLAKLDAALLPQQVIMEEFCFRSLPERLGAAALGDEAVDVMRIQLLRRAQAGAAIEGLLEPLWRQIHFPPLPAARPERGTAPRRRGTRES
jgi:Fe-S-cluster containining protein